MLKLVTSAIFFVSSKSSIRLRVLATMSHVETPTNGGETERIQQDSQAQTVASGESPDSTQTKEALKRPLEDEDNSAAVASNSGEAPTSNDSIVDPKSKRPARTAPAQKSPPWWPKRFFSLFTSGDSKGIIPRTIHRFVK